MSASGQPLLLHVVYRFQVGGLENGVVNLINRLPGYRHAVLAIDRCDSTFCSRVKRADTEFIELCKPPGQTLKAAPAYLKELRRLRPAVVHTRNLAALELQLPTWWSGIGARVHGEHGRDVDDLDGRSRRRRLVRYVNRPFVQRWVALSNELENYLVRDCGVPSRLVQRICNGVDLGRFQATSKRGHVPGSPFNDPELFVIGTVGRMQAVKAQTVLVDAFIATLRRQPELRQRLRLIMVGDGLLRADCEQRLQSAGVRELAWLPGERGDVPQLMAGMDAFVLPSRAEGISNTVLEAMACGLPVLATAVGGNLELVEEGVTGHLVPTDDVVALAQRIALLASDRMSARAIGHAGRERVERLFSLDGMVSTYDRLYSQLIAEQHF